MESTLRRTWAEIDLDALIHNYTILRERIGADTKFLGVVKADAYGHGSVMVAKTLEEHGADYLAVSSIDEAMELRLNGIKMPILILGHTPKEQVGRLIEYNITQAVTCKAKAIEYSEEASRLGKNLKIHIKVDTGMSRLGYICEADHFDTGVEGICQALNLPGLEGEGIFTHFAVSDEFSNADKEYTLHQFALFCNVIAQTEERWGHKFAFKHCANTGAVARYPQTYSDYENDYLSSQRLVDENDYLNSEKSVDEKKCLSSEKLDGERNELNSQRLVNDKDYLNSEKTENENNENNELSSQRLVNERNELSSEKSVDERNELNFQKSVNENNDLTHAYVRMNMVRPGLLLYGYGDFAEELGLKPVMALKTTVSTIKIYRENTAISYGGIYKTKAIERIGVLPYGYADGFFRSLSNKYSVMTADGPAQVRGKICMDMCMIDLTGKSNVDVGSEVEIFGPDNSLNEMAAMAGTIPYELTCAVSKRVPRSYYKDGKLVEKELMLRM